MKQIYLKFLCFCLLTLACITVSAYDIVVQGIYYNINRTSNRTSNEVTVTYGKTKYSGDVIIPDKISYLYDTYRVTSIGSSAFSGCSGLTSITIPEGVRSIDDYTFALCI